MAFESKWDLVNPELQQEIIDYAKEQGHYIAGRKYGSSVNMNEHALGQMLKRKYGTVAKKPVSKNGRGKYIPEEKELDAEELIFIEKLKKGQVGLEEAGKIVAAKVFEKMLKNPDDVKFVDFFRSELLKIKNQEVNDKKDASMELLNRLFSGQVPPKECPHCGAPLFTNIPSPVSVIVDGELT